MTITPYTNSFTPVTHGGSVSSSGVTNAATAFDWFALTGSGAIVSFITSASSTAPNDVQNKNLMKSTAQLARAAILPLVESESYISKFTSTKNLINTNINSILSNLNLIQDPNFSSSITSLVAAYTNSLTSITTSLNVLKSFENRIYSTSDSIDISSSTTISNYGTTQTLTSFLNAKCYISQLLDPVILNGNSIPVITSVNGNAGNAASLSTIFTNVQNSLASLTIKDNFSALVEMSTQNIFDNYAIDIQGYTSAATSGTWPTGGTAPNGVVPGIDFEIHLTGNYQTGTASAGTAGAPSATTAFW